MQLSITQAARELEEVRARVRGRALVAAGAGLAAAWLALVSPRLALVLALAAFGEALLTVASYAGRRRLLWKLAAAPETHVLPEVRRFGRRIVEPKRRAALARSILSLRGATGAPNALHLADRVADFWPDLEELARELAAPDVEIEPRSVADIHVLLSDGLESPLLNPRLDAETLVPRLEGIRAGIHSCSADASARGTSRDRGRDRSRRVPRTHPPVAGA